MAKSVLVGLYLLYGTIAASEPDAVAGVIAKISTINLSVPVTLAPAFALHTDATAGENRQRAVQSETLLRTASSWDGEPYKSYPSLAN